MNEWIDDELAELGDLPDGPDESDRVWLEQLLPALEEAGAAEEALGPEPDLIAARVLAEVRGAPSALTPSAPAESGAPTWWPVLLAAGLLGALGLGFLWTREAPPRPTIALAPSPAESHLPSASEAPTGSPAEDPGHEDSPEATPEREPSTPREPAPASPAPSAAPSPSSAPSPAPGPSPSAAPSPSSAPSPAPEPSPSAAPTRSVAPQPRLTPAPTALPSRQPTATPAPSQPRPTPASQRLTQLAQVTELEGRARVRRNGTWRELEVGAALLVGDELDLRGKAVCQLGCGPAGSLTLRERARLTLGEDDWLLSGGVCSLVAGDAPQRLRAGEVEVSPQPASEVALLHGASGRLAIEVFVGGAGVRGPAAQAELAPGQGLEAKRGRLGKVRPARSPKWLRAARLPEGRVVFEESCHSLRRGAYVVLLGRPTPSGLTAAPKPTAPRERAVSLGQGKRQGLFRAPSGARIHLQLTLESDQPVTLQLESPDHRHAWRAVFPGKAGLNTFDLALSELRPKSGPELSGGEALDFLSLQAGLPSQAHALTVQHIRVYLR